MAGRREGSGQIVEGFHTGDTSSGKYNIHVPSKDRKRKNECTSNKKGGRTHVPITASPPMVKGRQGHYSSYSRNSSDQRSYRNKGVSSDGLECIEKDMSLLAKEKKKLGHVSLSHLLNFTVSHSDRTPTTDHSSSTTVSGNGGRPKQITRRQSSYNKEQFLQANCQFIVRESEDYSVHITQSDLLVDWSNIEQIRLYCHEMSSCPVCLYLPTAAKITRCGHIFCYSCILHYLALSEKKWRKCPICYESIYKKDLRSVTTFASKKYEANDMVSMSLMKRKKGTTIVMPCEDWDDSLIKVKQIDEKYKGQFSKLVVASTSHVLNQVIEPEKVTLEEQLSVLSVNEESERCYIEAALKEVKLRIDSITQVGDNDASQSSKDVHEDSDILNTHTEENNTSDSTNESIGEDSMSTCGCKDTCSCSYDENNTSITSDSISDSSVCSSPSVSSQKDYVYFYQASDGQNMFLHPLNGKALVTEFGSWENCPNAISARIIELEHYTMTEDEKIRSKYLNHLPLTCEFVFCELELGPPLLSPRTEELFRDQVLKRKQKRQRKKREEKRLEKKQLKNQSLDMLYSPNSDDISVPEKFHDFLSIASSPPLPSLMHSDLSPVGIPSSKQNNPTLPKQPSFAQALAQGDTTKTVSCQVPPSVGMQDQGSMSDELNEGEQCVPSFQNSFSNALLTGNAHVISKENHEGKPRGSKSAKKGRKKIVLFSTAGGNHRM